MTAEQWPEIERLYHAARLQAPEVRAAFLATACSDPDVRRVVESLLEQPVSEEGLLDQRALAVAAHMSSDISTWPLTRRRIGKYAIEALLGAGGMGEVYKGRDAKLDRSVAIKILPKSFASNPDRLARFDREAKTLASLDHPNIAIVHGFEEADGINAIVMEFVDGPTLAARIAAGPIAVAEAVSIAHQIADALEAAHRKGIVHRDLKPANVIVRSDGIVKVLDFGLAKVIDASESSRAITWGTATTAGLIVGTASYVSPERAQGQAADKRADIWALGCVLFEMLTGIRAFDGDSARTTLARVVHQPVPWEKLPDDLPASIVRSLQRCLQKDPDERIPNVPELRLALASPFGSQRASVEHASRRRAKTIAWVVSIAAVATAAIGLFESQEILGTRSAVSVDSVHRQLTFSGDVTEATVSPDGRSLAYISSGRSWVQDVKSGRATEIVHSQSLRALKWSPRGDQIAFLSYDDVRQLSWTNVVSKLGGVPRRLAPGAFYAWSPDGSQIAVAFRNTDYLDVVDASDGHSATKIPLKGFQFLQDLSWHLRSHRMAILELSGAERWGIWVTGLGEGAARRIYSESNPISSICWSPVADVIYFLRSQNEATELMALDVTESGASELPRVLMSGLPQGGSLSIADDGHTLVHVRSTRRSNVARIDLTRSNSPLELITKGTQTFRTPSVSPDGAWIAAVVGEPPRTQVVKVPVSGGAPIPLTSGENFDGAPTWSPDGERIAFASTEAGARAVWTMRPDGADLQRIADSAPSESLSTHWTPDGRLMWQEASDGRQFNYRIRDLKSGRDSNLIAGNKYGWVFSPRFSADGKKLAVLWNTGNERSGLYVLSWPDRMARRLADATLRPLGWTADGTAVVATGALGLTQVSVRTGEVRVVAKAYLDPDGDVTPDGRYAVGTVSDGTADAWMIEHFDARFEHLNSSSRSTR